MQTAIKYTIQYKTSYSKLLNLMKLCFSIYSLLYDASQVNGCATMFAMPGAMWLEDLELSDNYRAAVFFYMEINGC